MLREHLNKFLIKYKWHVIFGLLFTVVTNIFNVLPAQVIRVAFDLVTENIGVYQLFAGFNRQEVIYEIFGSSLLLFGILVLVLSLIRVWLMPSR